MMETTSIRGCGNNPSTHGLSSQISSPNLPPSASLRSGAPPSLPPSCKQTPAPPQHGRGETSGAPHSQFRGWRFLAGGAWFPSPAGRLQPGRQLRGAPGVTGQRRGASSPGGRPRLCAGGQAPAALNPPPLTISLRSRASAASRLGGRGEPRPTPLARPRLSSSWMRDFCAYSRSRSRQRPPPPPEEEFSSPLRLLGSGGSPDSPPLPGPLMLPLPRRSRRPLRFRAAPSPSAGARPCGPAPPPGWSGESDRQRRGACDQRGKGAGGDRGEPWEEKGAGASGRKLRLGASLAAGQ